MNAPGSPPSVFWESRNLDSAILPSAASEDIVPVAAHPGPTTMLPLASRYSSVGGGPAPGSLVGIASRAAGIPRLSGQILVEDSPVAVTPAAGVAATAPVVDNRPLVRGAF